MEGNALAGTKCEADDKNERKSDYKDNTIEYLLLNSTDTWKKIMKS